MKRKIITGTGLILALLMASVVTQAQHLDADTTKKIVEERNYIFKAQTASTLRGQVIPLTSDYDLTVRPDSVIAYLPYYGRAYVAPINPAEGGIKFNSDDFEYNSEREKKDRWEIMIKPHDTNDVQDLYLTIYDNGSASLRINSRNRQAISFRGYIIEGRPLNKKAF